MNHCLQTALTLVEDDFQEAYVFIFGRTALGDHTEPENPNSMFRRTLWRIACSFNDFRSLVNVASITLQTPRMCSRAHSLASDFL